MNACYTLTNGLRPTDYARAFGLVNHLVHKNDRYLLGKYLDSKSVTKGPARAILKVISVKTLAFQKPYEMLNARTFIEGDEFVAGIGAVTTRTVTNGMRRLREADLICAFHRQGSDWYYALNLAPLFDFLTQWFSKPLDDDATSSERARYALWAELLKLKDLFPAMIATVKALAGRVFRDYGKFAAEAKEAMAQAVAVVEQKADAVVEAVKEVAETVKEAVTQKIEQAKEVVMNLADALKQVPKGSQVQREKLRAKSDQPFFDKKGRPIGRVALAFWHTKVRDYPERYGAYYETSTSKMVGQMSNLLNELKAQDKNEDEIRQYLTDLIENWHRPMFDNRKILITMQDEKPGVLPKSWHVFIPEMPEFPFYYPNRVAVSRQVFASINRNVASSTSGSALTKGFKFC